MFVKVDNANRIEKYPYTLDMFREENKNKSLPRYLNNRFLAKHKVFPVQEAEKPSYDEITQYIVAVTEPTYVDEKWVLEWVVKNKTQAQIDADTKTKESEIREMRDELLAETDWVTIRAIDEGVPVDQVWTDYRHSLRTVSDQDGFPWNVEWPTKP